MNPQTERSCDTGSIGEIWVSGPTVASGYWNRPEDTRDIFHAGLAEHGDTPFLRPTVYGLARRGALNRHLGLLPDFRGSDCAIWALALDQPESVGYSIHVVNERVDGGDVVLRRQMPIAGDATLEDYLRRLRREASESFTGVVGRLVAGAPLASLPQRRKGPYYPPSGFATQRRALKNYARAAAVQRTAPDGGVPEDPEERMRVLPG